MIIEVVIYFEDRNDRSIHLLLHQTNNIRTRHTFSSNTHFNGLLDLDCIIHTKKDGNDYGNHQININSFDDYCYKDKIKKIKEISFLKCIRVYIH